ncbi:MAG TPA: DUF4893 domain-containing protein [Rhizomicrobium sp.]|nr:DUF4893 domain-containing protein [Rhizomicrobium sp.]
MTKTAPHRLTLALVALLALTGSAFADWREQITNYDAGRLTGLEAARGDAVRQAQTRGGTGDYGAIKETFEADAHGVPEQALYGAWRCRQMKLGGMTGYAVFSWISCSISKRNDGIWFQKQGTQRMAGYLYPEQGGLWVYIGAQSARGEPLHRYSGRRPSLGAETTPDDQVGALVGIGNNRLRMDLPTPSTQESDFDAIELVR